MARLRIGYKPGVGGVVKVMRYDADDPFATPNNQHGRFLFNSETTKIGYVESIQRLGFDGSVGQSSYKYYPSGTNIDTCERVVWRSTTLENINVFPGRIINRNYPVVCEVRPYRALGTKILGPIVRYISTSGSTGGAGYNIGYPAWWQFMSRDTIVGGFQNPYSPTPITSWIMSSSNDLSWFDDDDDVLVSILDLPADDDPMPSASAGASGTRNATIRPTLVRIGKGGVIDSGGRDSVIIDSTRVPAKVVRAGQVSVGAGSSATINSPVTLTQFAYMDYMVWSGSLCAFPQPISGANVDGQNYDMSYAIFSDRVVIYNDGDHTLNVRYMICMDDGETTTGGSSVLRKLSNGHIQLKRPGSSDSAPRSRDILLDTRFSYLPIVAEGYIPYQDFTESVPSNQQHLGAMGKTITFDNDGSFVPFVKFFVKRDGGYIITQPWAKVLRTSADGPIADTWDNKAARDSTVALVTDTSVKFHMARNNPHHLTVNSSGGAEVDNDNEDRPDGIRYYIFAIPTNF